MKWNPSVLKDTPIFSWMKISQVKAINHKIKSSSQSHTWPQVPFIISYLYSLNNKDIREHPIVVLIHMLHNDDDYDDYDDDDDDVILPNYYRW